MCKALNKSRHAPFLVTPFLVGCFALSLPDTAAAQAAPQRSWHQTIRGYYDARGGWQDYKKYRAAMDQPLGFTRAQFKRLTISEIDRLARKAKQTHDLSV